MYLSLRLFVIHISCRQIVKFDVTGLGSVHIMHKKLVRCDNVFCDDYDIRYYTIEHDFLT